MEHNTLTPQQLETSITQRLKDLPPNLLNIVLLQYAHELTILARGYFIDDKFGTAKDCNEVIHRLLGFVISQMAVQDNHQVISMIETIVTSASLKGRLQILNGALLRALTPD